MSLHALANGAMEQQRMRWRFKNVQTAKMRDNLVPFSQKARREKLGWRTAPPRHTTLHREAILGRSKTSSAGTAFGMQAELRALKESMTGVPTNQIRRPTRLLSDEDTPEWVDQLRDVMRLDHDQAWKIYVRARRIVVRETIPNK